VSLNNEVSSTCAVESVAGEMKESLTVWSAVWGLCCRPKQLLWEQWNWKSAIVSSTSRALIFFIVNVSAGFAAATAAMITELCFRAVLAGFYGAMTQAFRSAHPRWAASLAVMILLPAANHSLEFLVHWVRGTPELIASIAASVAVTAISSSFYLFAMRRGAFIIGSNSRPLWHDIRSMPSLILAFIISIVRGIASRN